MVVILIMSLLICLSYPSYQQHIYRLHRVDGQTALFDLANRMEDYFAAHQSYEKSTIGTGRISDVRSSSLSDERWYILSITKSSQSDFLLTAVPIDTQQNDVDCQTLTLNRAGIKGSSPKSRRFCWGL